MPPCARYRRASVAVPGGPAAGPPHPIARARLPRRPRACTTARIVAEHTGTPSEPPDDLLARATHLTLIGDIRHEATNIRRDSSRRRRKFAVNHGDLLDDFFLKQRVDDPKPKSTRSA